MPKKTNKPKHYSAKVRSTSLLVKDETSFQSFVTAHGVTPSEGLRRIVGEYFSMKRLQEAGFDKTNEAVKRSQSEVIAPFKAAIDTLAVNQENTANLLNDVLNQYTREINEAKAERIEQREINNEIKEKLEDVRLIVKLTSINTITIRGLIYIFMINLKFGQLSLPQMTEDEVTALAKKLVIEVYKLAKIEEMDFQDGKNIEDISQSFATLFAEELKKIKTAKKP